MSLERRHILAGAAFAALAGRLGAAEPSARYGLIGRVTAQSGKRAELMAALTECTVRMSGCLSYVVAEDAADPNVIWVTEAWDSEASHKASLKLPAVRAAIARGRPLIASFETVATTRPIAGL